MSFPSVCLVVLDGWGLAPDGPGNAVALADTPVFDRLWSEHPHTTLTAKGEAVGLPEGQMGNSEVGHLNLGAGAIVPQDLARIDAAVADGTLAANETLRAAFADAERVHLIGLVSSGGVHSSEEHLKALIRLADEWNVPDLVIHAFTDGRDTSPTSGADSVAGVEALCDELGTGRVASVVGRYYAMDRDQRWERTEQAVDLLCDGSAEHHADTGEQAIRDAYERGETDEFITATTVGEEGADPAGRLRARVQLPARPHAPDHDEADRGRRPLRDAHPVRRGVDVPGRVPAAPAGDHDRRR